MLTIEGFVPEMPPPTGSELDMIARAFGRPIIEGNRPEWRAFLAATLAARGGESLDEWQRRLG
jgi:hypothetical protein